AVQAPAVPTADAPAAPPAWADPAATPAEPTPAPAPDPTAGRSADPESVAAARDAIQQTRATDQPRAESGPDWAAVDADADPDDLDAETQGLDGAELLRRELGAQVIDEIRHQ
ncbi:MAG: polymerase subunit gamma and tau, partial [Nocardioides sp.]|nr:polymerase subunit gamma and tau [Nocardioides sp.]